MRVALIAAASACAMLTACGGPETSQANNAQANIANDASSDATANASAVSNGLTMVAAGPVSKDQAAKVMHERHEGMESIGKATKAVRRELEGSSPNLATVRASAAQIADLAGKSAGWFPAGTGPDVGKTGAKPEIWKDPKDFSAKIAAFQKAAQAFNAAASGGDLTTIKARFAELGQSCKACHDKYRMEMKH